MHASFGPNVSTSLEAGVLAIAMSDVETSNALTVGMSAALAEALESVNALREVNCVILKSTAKHFCTGGNVKDMQRGDDLMSGSVEDVQDRLRSCLHRITHAIHGIEVPTIAAVNGLAIGAGFDLSLMCDVRIASEKARFAESFLRLGLISGIGGAWFLASIVGPARALELTLTSEFIDAQTALTYGIVSKVVAAEVLDAEAHRMASQIASMPPRALRLAKRLVRESSSSSLAASLEMAGATQAILLCGREHKDAVTKFLSESK
jgi:enoyl-CoA hydratase/carnithine racemase